MTYKKSDEERSLVFQGILKAYHDYEPAKLKLRQNLFINVILKIKLIQNPSKIDKATIKNNTCLFKNNTWCFYQPEMTVNNF